MGQFTLSFHLPPAPFSFLLFLFIYLLVIRLIYLLFPTSSFFFLLFCFTITQ